MQSIGARYEGGDHVGVWDDIRKGWISKEDSAIVAELTMRRVSAAVDIIIERLNSYGWLWSFSATPPREYSSTRDLEALILIEERIGPLPAALRSCLLHVTGVSLGGTFPGWSFTTHWELQSGDSKKPLVYADPLSLPTATDLLIQIPESVGQDSPQWEWLFTGDYLRKAGMSGGGDFLRMPCIGPDPYLDAGKWPVMTLVEYLRLSLRYGGFPGFAFASNIPELVRELAQGLPTI